MQVNRGQSSELNPLKLGVKVDEMVRLTSMKILIA